MASRNASAGFGQLLDGVVFAISGIVNPERAEVRERALAMGAEYRPEWTPDCSLLLAVFANAPKNMAAKAGGATIVHKDWLHACFKGRCLIPIGGYLMHAGLPIVRQHPKQEPFQPHRHAHSSSSAPSQAAANQSVPLAKAEPCIGDSRPDVGRGGPFGAERASQSKEMCKQEPDGQGFVKPEPGRVSTAQSPYAGGIQASGGDSFQSTSLPMPPAARHGAPAVKPEPEATSSPLPATAQGATLAMERSSEASGQFRSPSCASAKAEREWDKAPTGVEGASIPAGVGTTPARGGAHTADTGPSSAQNSAREAMPDSTSNSEAVKTEPQAQHCASVGGKASASAHGVQGLSGVVQGAKPEPMEEADIRDHSSLMLQPAAIKPEPEACPSVDWAHATEARPYMREPKRCKAEPLASGGALERTGGESHLLPRVKPKAEPLDVGNELACVYGTQAVRDTTRVDLNMPYMASQD